MADTQTLLDLYAAHPLREGAILDRIRRTRGTLEGITELDLAHDSLTELTDQNHVGGLAAVVQLAVAAGVTDASRVLDLGSGLGGPARALAYLFGCRVHGVELSPLRCAEGASLTARVTLEHLVTWTCGDILAVDLPPHAFDVVYGQGAWIHIADTPHLFERIAAALVPGGRVAFEEGCLARTPRTDSEAHSLAELEQLWGGRFLSREAWESALAGASLHASDLTDLTEMFVSDFERLETIARAQGAGRYPAHETRAFTLAVELARAGVIEYSRVVASARSG